MSLQELTPEDAEGRLEWLQGAAMLDLANANGDDLATIAVLDKIKQAAETVAKHLRDAQLDVGPDERRRLQALPITLDGHRAMLGGLRQNAARVIGARDSAHDLVCSWAEAKRIIDTEDGRFTTS